jgi:hypothetical protein
MRTVCSFCGTVIRPGKSLLDPVNHGVCESCYTSILTRYRFNVQKFLNLLDAPVFLVDADVNILAANTLAVAAANKPVALVKGNLCGKVLECINALLPGGCGMTPFCPDCVIRMSVNETYASGKPVTCRPATLIRKIRDTEEKVHLLISTQKDGGIVLLRLEIGDVA